MVLIRSRALRAPSQTRSRDTLERILAATRQLLERKTFAAISVAEIARRGDSSVGSFYARFADKDGLLDHLDERYAREMIAQQEAFLAAARRPHSSLDQVVTDLVTWLVRYHRQRRGLLRALVLRARTRKEKRFSERTSRMNERLIELMAALLRHRAEIRHPHPARAVALGFFFTFSALREWILFPESITTGESVTDAILIRELKRAYLAYLNGQSHRSRRGKASVRAVPERGVP